MSLIRATVLVEIDTELYPVPADGKLSESIRDDLEAIADEISGLEVKKVSVRHEFFS